MDASSISQNQDQSRRGLQLASNDRVVIFKDLDLFNSRVEGHDFELARQMIEKDPTLVNCESLNSNDLKQVHKMLVMENYAAFKFLIENGADINCSDQSGLSLLHTAVMSNNLDIVKYLVEHGANLFATAYFHKMPIDFAKGEIYTYLSDQMLKETSKTNKSFKSIDCIRSLINPNNDKVVEDMTYEEKWQNYVELLNHFNYDQNQMTKKGLFVLHSLVVDDMFELFKYLIEEKSWDYDSLDVDLNTPLQIAVQYDNFKFCEYLIKQCHADINLANINGLTPIYSSLDSPMEIYRLFLECPESQLYHAKVPQSDPNKSILIDTSISDVQKSNDDASDHNGLLGESKTLPGGQSRRQAFKKKMQITPTKIFKKTFINSANIDNQYPNNHQSKMYEKTNSNVSSDKKLQSISSSSSLNEDNNIDSSDTVNKNLDKNNINTSLCDGEDHKNQANKEKLLNNDKQNDNLLKDNNKKSDLIESIYPDISSKKSRSEEIQKKNSSNRNNQEEIELKSNCDTISSIKNKEISPSELKDDVLKADKLVENVYKDANIENSRSKNKIRTDKSKKVQEKTKKLKKDNYIHKDKDIGNNLANETDSYFVENDQIKSQKKNTLQTKNSVEILEKKELKKTIRTKTRNLSLQKNDRKNEIKDPNYVTLLNEQVEDPTHNKNTTFPSMEKGKKIQNSICDLKKINTPEFYKLPSISQKFLINLNESIKAQELKTSKIKKEFKLGEKIGNKGSIKELAKIFESKSSDKVLNEK